MRTVKILFLFLLLAISTLLLADGTQPLGEGTSANPYQMESYDNLLWLQSNQTIWNEGLYFEQTSDIDASITHVSNGGQGALPIGLYDNLNDGINDFVGHYNGNNFAIINLYINRPNQYFVGMFGSLLNASVSNLTLTNVTIYGQQGIGSFAGISRNSSLDNCHTNGQVNGTSNVGGICGDINDSSISEVSFTGNVTSQGYHAGGIASYVSNNSQITDCFANGTISANIDAAGGIVGYITDSSIIKSYFIGDVLVSEDYVGGLVGDANNSTFSECFTEGSVSGDMYVGGLIGKQNSGCSVDNSYSLAHVQGNDIVAALVAMSGINSTISYSYAAGVVVCDSDENRGGIAAIAIGAESVVNSFWNVSTTGINTSPYGMPLVNSAFMDIDSYLDYGWDFINELDNGSQDIWAISSNVNSGYPYLDFVDIVTPNINEEVTVLQPRLKNYPNPFNPETTISFNIDRNDSANLRIYNIKGQLIKDLGVFTQGQHEVIWNGEDRNNNKVASGIYLYQLKTARTNEIKKMILSK